MYPFPQSVTPAIRSHLEAQVAFALARPDMAPAMRGILQRYA